MMIAQDKLEKRIIEEGRRQFEMHKVKELQRQKQQGLGRPIISTQYKDYRFVAVANRMFYGKWKSFSDFLMEYIKQAINGGWGNAEIAKPWEERHPLMQWYDKVCRLQAAHAKGPGEIFTTPFTGAVSAHNRLAYNLYLIAHNGKDIQTRLIARLKDKNNFQGAFFETQVAAWLIKAGFELEFEDETDRSSTHCEFTATYTPTGEKYSVEAKSRELETSKASRAKVGRKLYEALEKKANHKRLIFLDLNKPLHTREAADIAMDRAERIVGQSEGLQINGTPAPPAYVCITNMNDQYSLDTASISAAILFRGYKIHDFMGDDFPSLREAARARERHWPMFQLFKSIEEHREIPATFEGELPSEVFVANPIPRLQVGQAYLVPGPDGKEVAATLTSVVVNGNRAVCAFHDPKTDSAWLGTAPMTPEELADYERHPETYFGAGNQKPTRTAETAMDLFDFFFDGYKETPREKLIELIGAIQEDLTTMSDKELRELLAERYTMHAIAQGAPLKKRRGQRVAQPRAE
jgi:hypothetical protein